MQRFPLRTAATLFGVAIILVAWSLVATSRDRTETAAQNTLILALERLVSAGRDMETASRGFALVGNESFLGPFTEAVQDLPRIEAEVRSAWAAVGHEESALNGLLARLREKEAVSRRIVEARTAGGPDRGRDAVAEGNGKRVMDALRREATGLQDEAASRRDTIDQAERRRSAVLLILATVFALAACAYLGWLAWVRRRAVQAASAELVGLGDRFRTLADNIPQLAWMADSSGTIYWYNQRWYDFTGLTIADMTNDGWKKVHDPDLVDQVTERYQAAIASGEDWEDTFPLRRHDGGYRWFLSRAQPIRDETGEIKRWFGTNTDITEQREQEQELAAARDAAEEANRAKSQFLANMSHELRTPLSAVIGYSEMLEEEVEELGQEHLLDDLSKIKSNARHLLSLINDVLDISKIEANKMELFAETFDIADMITDVGATVGALMEKKSNRLIVAGADGLGTMHSDVVKVRQILINLLSNAAKFTESGEITLSAERVPSAAGDEILFRVRDTGLGMTAEQLSRLFQRFSQADISTTRRFGGTGLGLAITKAFTGMLGGRVNVASEPGRGSTFEIAIPADLPPPASDSDEAVVDVDTAEEGVVLVIDDDPATRDLLSRFLAREGFTVRVAEDGKSGLALAATLKPRVILLDVTMPRMDGWTVLRNLKDDPHLAAIPVVMCTVIDEQNLGFTLGASDYILKPIDWERLRDVLARVERIVAKGDVLVVDDDGPTRERLDTVLAKNGWTVTEATNGREGLEAVKARVPSLVLLDLNMPEMDGFTFLRELRQNPAWAEIPVIVMTARDLSAGERAELKGSGASVYEKGRVSMKELVGQLRALPRRPAPALEKTGS